MTDTSHQRTPDRSSTNCFLARRRPPKSDPLSTMVRTVCAYHQNGHIYVAPLLGPDKFESLGKHETDQEPEQWLLQNGYEDVRPHPRRPGEFFPRMWRPGWCPSSSELSQGSLTRSCLNARPLVQRLREVFSTAEPVSKTDAVYGPQIRSLLLLACMEVEAAWKGVLRANAYPVARWSTNDYVKLLHPLALADYEVTLAWYPDYPAFKPFASWSADQPTGSLRWYDAYNAAKHDSERELHRASLRNAIQAVGALVVMLFAQFGPCDWDESQSPHGERDWRADFTSDLKITYPLGWTTSLALSEFLVPAPPPSQYGPPPWSPVQYQFPS